MSDTTAKKVVHRIEVYDDGDRLWMPRPSSWMTGLARHTVVERATGRRAGVMSPDQWGRQHGRAVLVIYGDGTWEVTDR